MGERTGWHLLRDSPSFRRFVMADGLSQTGDWFTYIAMGVIAGQSSHASTAVTLVVLAHTLPRALAAFAGGRMLDQSRLRTVLVCTDALRAAIVLVMIWAVRSHTPWLLHLGHITRMTVGALADTAHRAVVPQLVRPSDIPRANKLQGVLWSLAFAGGSLSGGWIVQHCGVELAFGLDALSYVGASLLALTLPPMEAPARLDANTQTVSWQALFTQLRDRRLLGVVLARAPATLLHGSAFVGVSLVAPTVFAGQQAMAIGALHAVRSVGSALGPWIVERWSRSLRARLLTSWLLLCVGAVIVILPLGSVLAFTGALAWGVGSGGNWVHAQTAMHQKAPAGMLGRICALDLVCYTAMQALGSVMVAVLWGVHQAGIALVVCVGLSFALQFLVWKQLDEGET